MDGMLSSKRDSPSFTRATGKTPVRSSVRFPGVRLIMTNYPQFTIYFNWSRILGRKAEISNLSLPLILHIITQVKVSGHHAMSNKHAEPKLSLQQWRFKLLSCQTKSFLIFYPAVNPTGSCLGPHGSKFDHKTHFLGPPSETGATGGPESL